MHQTRTVALIILLSMFWEACATPTSHPPFPANVVKDVDSNFDFTTWREAPQAYVGRKVEVGGQILQAEIKDGGVLIVAEQLPIVQRPVYGPSGTDKRPGAFDFAVFYPSLLNSSALTAGNRFVVVGTPQGTTEVTVKGAPKREPLIVAQCIHIWKTKGAEIADYPFEVDAGYVPLEQQTSCVSARGHPKQ